MTMPKHMFRRKNNNKVCVVRSQAMRNVTLADFIPFCDVVCRGRGLLRSSYIATGSARTDAIFAIDLGGIGNHLIHALR